MSISSESDRPDVPAPQPGSVTRDESSQLGPFAARVRARLKLPLKLSSLDGDQAVFSTTTYELGRGPGRGPALHSSVRYYREDWEEKGRPLDILFEVADLQVSYDDVEPTP